MSDSQYQKHTALYHMVLAAGCVTAVGWCVWRGSVSPTVGLMLTAVTNVLIGLEKLNLLRRGKA